MTIFIGGSITIKNLDQNIYDFLDLLIVNNVKVLIGDANGVDTLIQSYFCSKDYSKMTVYSTNGVFRNKPDAYKGLVVEPPAGVTKGYAFYAAKDIKMIDDTDAGFMVWNGKSRGTYNNIVNLLSNNKKVIVYSPQVGCFYEFIDDINFEDAKRLTAQECIGLLV